MTKRHIWIPDLQLKKGVPMDHLRWAARAICDYEPTQLTLGGDGADMPSLSQHDKPGSKGMEGARYKDDIDAVNEGYELLLGPVNKKRKRKRSWKCRIDELDGNHEHRITRAINNDPKLDGVLSLDHIIIPGATRHGFLEVIERDGIYMSHYFQPPHGSRPIGGQIVGMLNQIGDSFVCGHVQGFSYGNRMFPTGKIRHGLVAGSFYQHDEQYRGAQGRTKHHWNGIVVLNDVRDGNYEIMPLSLEFLRRRFGGKKK